ncbi:MAG TPA: DUF1643 domain-containing protein [Bacteroidia bacterium]|nr:DUF1643 domain-containing protein [Bacteroidia bacterium]
MPEKENPKLKTLVPWLYHNDHHNTVRYILGTEGKRPLVCIGINPSTAEPDRLDNTLKSVARLAKSNGFDSWIMLNVYPQRATDPDHLHRKADAVIHRKNLAAIEKMLSGIKGRPVIWAAWGTLIDKRDFLSQCLRDIYHVAKKHHCRWVTIGGVTKDGHPRHPLRMSAATKTTPFAIDDYMKRVENW